MTYRDFNELQNAVAQFVNERHWNEGENPKDFAMCVAVEAAELLQLFQWQTSDKAVEDCKDETFLERVSEETADVLIYCTRLANYLGLDLGEIIAAKMKKNALKYPVTE